MGAVINRRDKLQVFADDSWVYFSTSYYECQNGHNGRFILLFVSVTKVKSYERCECMYVRVYVTKWTIDSLY